MVADDQIIAKRAAKRVIVEYDELPATITIEDAIVKESFYLDERKIVKGNPSAVFSTCDHVIEGDMRTGAQEHFYLETNACIAIPKGENGGDGIDFINTESNRSSDDCGKMLRYPSQQNCLQSEKTRWRIWG